MPLSLFYRNRLLPIRPDRYDRHGLAHQFADAGDIAPRRGWQIAHLANAGQVRLPTGQRFVHWFAGFEQKRVAGEVACALAIEVVRGANLQFVDAAQDVQQHDREFVDAAEQGGRAHSHGVEPAATPRPAGDGAVLATRFANALSNAVGTVVEFGGKGAAADARRVRFHDAENA